MPFYQKGDMLAAPGVHIVTGNSCLSSDGTLVMGLGAALAFKKKHPESPRIFGAMVAEYCGHQGRYGFLLHGNKGILQTRCDMNGKLDPGLIAYGLAILRTIAEGNRDMTYHLIHPGMTLHRTTLPEIDALLETLPDNVWVWQR